MTLELTIPTALLPVIGVGLIALGAFLLTRRPKRKDELMATLQELNDDIAAQTAASETLNATVARSVPVIRDAGNRIDPAQLDGPLAQIRANTSVVQASVAAINAVLPPG